MQYLIIHVITIIKHELISRKWLVSCGVSTSWYLCMSFRHTFAVGLLSLKQFKLSYNRACIKVTFKKVWRKSGSLSARLSACSHISASRPAAISCYGFPFKRGQGSMLGIHVISPFYTHPDQWARARERERVSARDRERVSARERERGRRSLSLFSLALPGRDY